MVSTTINASAGTTTNKRAIDSSVVVEDGSIIVLGGLLQDQTSINQDKVPVLGEHPHRGQFVPHRNEIAQQKQSDGVLAPRHYSQQPGKPHLQHRPLRPDAFLLQHPVEQFGTGSTQNPP